MLAYGCVQRKYSLLSFCWSLFMCRSEWVDENRQALSVAWLSEREERAFLVSFEWRKIYDNGNDVQFTTQGVHCTHWICWQFSSFGNNNMNISFYWNCIVMKYDMPESVVCEMWWGCFPYFRASHSSHALCDDESYRHIYNLIFMAFWSIVLFRWNMSEQKGWKLEIYGSAEISISIFSKVPVIRSKNSGSQI